MSTKVLVEESSMQEIGMAIRSKNGSETTYKPSEMPSAILAIPSYPEPTGSISITQNGTANVKDYASANVNVPNSYAAGDEGKVVSSGALVAQTSKNINANGTVDTTTNNQVVVNVANTYTAGDEGKVVSDGALASQSSQTISQNGTYDTTLKNEVVVSVSGGTPNLQSKTVTENGTVTADTGYDGLSSVVVNVSGGGGGSGWGVASTELDLERGYIIKASEVTS